MNKKREAREFCFQYFFHMQLPIFQELKHELANDGSSQALRDSLIEFKESTNTILSDELNLFVEQQVTSTLKHYAEIEKVLEKYLKNWKLHRISRVEHTNLLLAANDLCFTKSAPVNIIINEAIEISKKFGSLESGSFINGILDNIAKNEL